MLKFLNWCEQFWQGDMTDAGVETESFFTHIEESFIRNWAHMRTSEVFLLQFNLNMYVNYFIAFFYIGVCVHMYMCPCMWISENNAQSLVLSLYHVSLKD